MKKIILLMSLILMGTVVCAEVINMPSAPIYNGLKPALSEAEYKESFYDGFIVFFRKTAKNKLISQGFQEDSVQIFTQELEERINRTDLENSTWACVSKYHKSDIMNNVNEINKKCCYDWTINFIIKNADLAEKYLKK